MLRPQDKLPVTVFVAAKDEAVNLRRCLPALERAQRVVLLDSASRDGTQEIALAHGAEVVQFEYAGGYPKKRQWALDNVRVHTPWVLLIDADEVVPEPLWREIAEVIAAAGSCPAYSITKGFHFLGRPFRFGGFSHSAVIFFKTGAARFEKLLIDSPGAFDMEVHERVLVEGTIGRLREPLVHEDFKGLEAYIDRHNRYSSWEARVRHAYLRSGKYGEETIAPRLFGNTQERRRFLKALAMRAPFEHKLWFWYHYLIRLGFLHGRRGLIASQIRASYIAQVHAKLYELRLSARGHP